MRSELQLKRLKGLVYELGRLLSESISVALDDEWAQKLVEGDLILDLFRTSDLLSYLHIQESGVELLDFSLNLSILDISPRHNLETQAKIIFIYFSCILAGLVPEDVDDVGNVYLIEDGVADRMAGQVRLVQHLFFAPVSAAYFYLVPLGE